MGLFRRKLDPESALESIEDSYDRGDLDGVKKILKRARKLFPENLDFKEWEATLAADEERPAEALKILDAVLAREPGRYFATRERASVLVDLGRFDEALEALEALETRPEVKRDATEKASVSYEMGLCLDRAGKKGEADARFKSAARLSEGRFPPRMGRDEFHALVKRALDSVPQFFQRYLSQVAVLVDDYPSPKEDDPFLLGLYVGVPRTDRTQEFADNLDRILIFKRNHELLNLTPAEIEDEVRKTVIHEIAHHFGLDEESMGEYA